MGSLLPEGFEDLSNYVETGWALETQQERNDKRCLASMAELNAFYATMIARIEAIATHLNRYPLEAIPLQAARLLQLGQMLMEIAPAVEVMKNPDIPTDFPRERLIIHPQNRNYKIASDRSA
jgi:hypothetical protein